MSYAGFVKKVQEAKQHETRVKYAAECPDKDDEGKRMSVNRYLFELVFKRDELGTDEDIIEELRATGLCSEKFMEDDVTAKRNLAWAKTQYSNGRVDKKMHNLNQPFTSNKRRDADSEPSKKEGKAAPKAAASKGKPTVKKVKKPKVKGVKKEDAPVEAAAPAAE